MQHNFVDIFFSKFSAFFSGTAYGLGVYFARDARYSVNYTGRVGYGGRYMYLAKVLVGQYCVGNPSMKVPPPKNHQNLKFFTILWLITNQAPASLLFSLITRVTLNTL